MARCHSKASFEKVLLLSTLAGTKHFPEIIFLFVALTSYCFISIAKALTGKARSCKEKILVTVKRVSKALPKGE